MIVRKSWISERYRKSRITGRSGWITYQWRGWFLFGIIPLYLERYVLER